MKFQFVVFCLGLALTRSAIVPARFQVEDSNEISLHSATRQYNDQNLAKELLEVDAQKPRPVQWYNYPEFALENPDQALQDVEKIVEKVVQVSKDAGAKVVDFTKQEGGKVVEFTKKEGGKLVNKFVDLFGKK